MFWFRRDLFRNKFNETIRFPQVCIALQPIVSLKTKQVYAYEALCRGVNGENYPQLAAKCGPRGTGALDRVCAAKALQLAAKLGVTRTGAKLSLNMRPSTDGDALNIRYIARAAQHFGIQMQDIIVELTEENKVSSDELRAILRRHQMAGVATAIDDFGAGYAGLNLMAVCPPDMLKIDRELVHGIDSSEVRQTIVNGFVAVCHKLGSKVVVEGVETVAEYETLRDIGIDLMQGNLFAAPGLECAPVPVMEFGRDIAQMPSMVPAIAV